MRVLAALLAAIGIGLAPLALAYAQELSPPVPEPSSRPSVEEALPPPTEAARQQTNERDAALIAQGQSSFESRCTNCHDANRALGKSKPYSAWLSTVRRMAGKDHADIPASEHTSIAAYLASRSGTGSLPAAEEREAPASNWSFGAIVSLLHRSATDEAPLENPGFFPHVWLTASYQSTGPWRAQVTSCTTCHTQSSTGLELLEGNVTLDLRHALCGAACEDGVQANVKAGRLIVPFGAFAARSNPSINRTVTNPLMFDMGRRVFVPGSSPPNQPVIPMPFADEGIDLILNAPVLGDLTATLDLYAVNGLQSNTPEIFLRSRAWYDNNEDPSVGARATIGDSTFRIGGSVLNGNLADQSLPLAHYTLAGVDATAKLTERWRLYYEYAMRRQDSAALPGEEEVTSGMVAEMEYQVWAAPYIGLLVRYDTLDHRHSPFGDASLERFTSGINVGLPGGGLLMFNHEHWMPSAGDDVDVYAVRFVVAL